MEKVTINASRSYDVLIGNGILDRAGELISAVLKAKRACIITDDNVDRL